MSRPAFLNFKVDHMTLLVQPELYNLSYLIFRTIFGCSPEHILYEKRKEWENGKGEQSLTYAMQIGEGRESNVKLENTIIAVVQPSEPKGQPSHVREMLSGHRAAAHWQHIALRTPDLMAFHRHALERAVNFITPVLHDDNDDVIQIFSGEWFLAGSSPSGMFFEFVQRNPTPELLKKLEDHNRQSWFNDKTFLGLYGEKESEYQSGRVMPFLDFELQECLYAMVKSKKLWEITDRDIANAEEVMKEYARKREKN